MVCDIAHIGLKKNILKIQWCPNFVVLENYCVSVFKQLISKVCLIIHPFLEF